MTARRLEYLFFILSALTHTSSEGHAFPRKHFARPMLVSEILEALDSCGVIHYMDKDSWKTIPGGTGAFEKAEARRYLPSVELLVRQLQSMRFVDSSEDCRRGKSQPRPRSPEHGSFTARPSSRVIVPRIIIDECWRGTGLWLDRSRIREALESMKYDVEKRNNLMALRGAAGGCVGEIRCQWYQGRTGRLSPRNPGLGNTPKEFRQICLHEPGGGDMYEIDYSAQEPAIAAALIGMRLPPDFYPEIADRIGRTEKEAKMEVIAILHKRRPRTYKRNKELKKLRPQERSERMEQHEDTYKIMKEIFGIKLLDELEKNPDTLQKLGAETIVKVIAETIEVCKVRLGLPLHDGWILSIKNEDNVVQIQQIFRDSAKEIVGQEIDAKATKIG
ncbi:hypothetical protein ES707_08435 [subsurface metagenome]